MTKVKTFLYWLTYTVKSLNIPTPKKKKKCYNYPKIWTMRPKDADGMPDGKQCRHLSDGFFRSSQIWSSQFAQTCLTIKKT